MKNRNFFLAAAASILALAGCNKEIDYGPAKVEVDKAEIEVTQGAGSVSVSLNATIDWAAKVDGDDADWLDISPASGGPSLEAQTLTIKYTENTGINREATILVQGDVLHKTYINVKQAGPKGDEDSCTIAEFIQKGDTQHEYVLEGKVSNVIHSSYTTFNINDDSGSILVYSFTETSKELAETVKNGGIIKIKGTYQYYESKSQHEVVNAEILSYEAPMAVDPSTIETITVKDFLDKADPTTTYRLVGTVKGFNSQYCSFDLEDSTGSIYVYSVDAESKTAFADKLANGKKVTLTGVYFWYENKNDASKSKAEINPATIEKVEDGEGGDDGGEGSGDDGGQGGAPTEFTKVTVAEFLAASPSTTKWYQLTGEITNIANTTYGNFTIKDETGEVYIYGLTKTYVPQNDKSFSEIGLKKGDVVTLNGLRSEYNGTIETAGTPPAFYVSHTAGEGEKFPEGSVILTFPDDNSSSNALKSKQYETEWTAKSGSNEFKIFAFNNNGWKDWAFIRAGRKSVESTATIATSTKIAAKISKVVVTFDSIETGDVKSIKVISASDAAFTTDVAEVSVTPAQGDVEFKIAAPAGNMYYKLVVDCKASSKDKNGFVQVSRVAYIAAE